MKCPFKNRTQWMTPLPDLDSVTFQCAKRAGIRQKLAQTSWPAMNNQGLDIWAFRTSSASFTWYSAHCQPSHDSTCHLAHQEVSPSSCDAHFDQWGAVWLCNSEGRNSSSFERALSKWCTKYVNCLICILFLSFSVSTDNCAALE